MTFYKFSNTALQEAPTARTFEEIKKIYESKCHSNLHSLLRGGYYKLMGWHYSYCDELRQFYYTDNNGSCYKAYAPNKTLLRIAVYGTIFDIVEV